MKIISRYVLKEGVFLFGLCLTGLTLIFLIIDFFDRIQRYAGKDGAPISLSLLYFFYKIPEIIYQMAPMTALFAGILTLTVLSKSNELIAFRAGGISLRRICMPLLAGSVVLSVLLLLFAQYVAPFSTSHRQSAYRHIKAYGKMKKEGGDVARYLKEPAAVISNWQRGDGYVFFVRRTSSGHKKLHSLSLFETGPDMELIRRFDALTAEWNGNAWIGKNVTVRSFGVDTIDTVTHKSLELPIREKPDELTSPEGDIMDMSISELYKVVRKFKKRGLNAREYEVEFHSKLAYSFSAIILTLLALPLGIRGVRSGGGASFGIILAIAFGVLYWAVFAQATNLGKAGAINPILSAWVANILFGVVGISIFKGIDRQ